MGLVFLLYVIAIAWTVKSQMGNNVLRRVSENAWEKGVEATNEKDYGKAGVFFIAFPMILVGMVMVGVLIFSMLFLL